MNISGVRAETRSLVFKMFQSSVRPEVLEELIGRGKGFSELSWIINYDQVSHGLVYTEMLGHTGAGSWFLLHTGKKLKTSNPHKV